MDTRCRMPPSLDPLESLRLPGVSVYIVLIVFFFFFFFFFFLRFWPPHSITCANVAPGQIRVGGFLFCACQWLVPISDISLTCLTLPHEQSALAPVFRSLDIHGHSFASVRLLVRVKFILNSVIYFSPLYIITAVELAPLCLFARRLFR